MIALRASSSQSHVVLLTDNAHCNLIKTIPKARSEERGFDLPKARSLLPSARHRCLPSAHLGSAPAQRHLTTSCSRKASRSDGSAAGLPMSLRHVSALHTPVSGRPTHAWGGG